MHKIGGWVQREHFDEACIVSFIFSIDENESRHYSVGFTASNFQVIWELLKHVSEPHHSPLHPTRGQPDLRTSRRGRIPQSHMDCA